MKWAIRFMVISVVAALLVFICGCGSERTVGELKSSNGVVVFTFVDPGVCDMARSIYVDIRVGNVTDRHVASSVSYSYDFDMTDVTIVEIESWVALVDTETAGASEASLDSICSVVSIDDSQIFLGATELPSNVQNALVNAVEQSWARSRFAALKSAKLGDF